VAALTFALNNITSVSPPLSVVASLLIATETIDTTLDQMKPGSEFIKELAASPDPKVAYTCIVGNTELLPKGKKYVDRFVRALRETIQIPFFNQPNDIAVTVASAHNLPPGRIPEPQRIEVACDHLTYFSDLKSLETLNSLLFGLTDGSSQQ
jgi:hypothetical protein